MKTITLRDGKERSLQRRHPWVFEGRIGNSNVPFLTLAGLGPALDPAGVASKATGSHRRSVTSR